MLCLCGADDYITYMYDISDISRYIWSWQLTTNDYNWWSNIWSWLLTINDYNWWLQLTIKHLIMIIITTDDQISDHDNCFRENGDWWPSKELRLSWKQWVFQYFINRGFFFAIWLKYVTMKTASLHATLFWQHSQQLLFVFIFTFPH